MQEHPGVCALSIQWEKKLGLHSRNEDKDIKRSESLKGTVIFTGDQEPVEKPREEGCTEIPPKPPQFQGSEEIRASFTDHKTASTPRAISG